MEASALSGRLDVIRYRVDTQPIITDPASIFLSRKSRNINMSTLVVDRCRKSPQKSWDVGVDRVRRRRIAVQIADDVREQCQQNGRLSFRCVSGARQIRLTQNLVFSCNGAFKCFVRRDIVIYKILPHWFKWRQVTHRKNLKKTTLPIYEQ